MGTNPSGFKKGDRYPVDYISWPDAQIFIQKLNSLSSQNYRLPTEAEWEYAARSGGKNEKFAGSASPDSVAWYDGSSDWKPHRVGKKLPNGLGIDDMSGNVKEWCQDWYNMNYYQVSPKNNPKGPSTGERRIVRGGHYKRIEEQVRTSYRDGDLPDDHKVKMGFCLVLPVKN
jgi:formylglycine-generating enzyme required for sulfatase activity